MIKYIIIDKETMCTLKRVFVFSIPFYWIYCKIKGYTLLIYERRDLD